MKKTIFICDDDLDILEVCRYLLEKNGYDVETFSSYEDVLEKIELQKPDIMLVDLWMPGIGGEMAAQILKSKESTRHIPLLLFSANNEVEQIAKAVNADGFVKKPFDTRDLKNIIEATLSRVAEQP